MQRHIDSPSLILYELASPLLSRRLSLRSNTTRSRVITYRTLWTSPQDFCPGFNVPGDLMAEVDQVTATNLIGQMVGAFLHLHIESVPASTAASALNLIASHSDWTAKLMTP